MQSKQTTVTITLDAIEIVVIKKNIKNIHLSVNHIDGNVKMSVPKSLSDKAIREFILNKLSWIKKQKNKIANGTKLAKREYVTGENVYVFGKLYNLIVIESNTRNSLEIIGEDIILKCTKNCTVEERHKCFNKWLTKLLKHKVASLMEKWSSISGLNCDIWQIRNMKTRWGTYSPNAKKIWLNLQLAKQPTECIEYVIMHELAHVLQANHGDKFIAIMDRFMPDWRARKKQLNSQTHYYLD